MASEKPKDIDSTAQKRVQEGALGNIQRTFILSVEMEEPFPVWACFLTSTNDGLQSRYSNLEYRVIKRIGIF